VDENALFHGVFVPDRMDGDGGSQNRPHRNKPAARAGGLRKQNTKGVRGAETRYMAEGS